MFFVYYVVVTFVTLHNVVGDSPNFRILAPEFVCPKDEEALIDKPDNNIITIQTDAGANLSIKWTVRWTHLPAPSQRFTLLLWRAVRALEKKLNGPQSEPFVYIIDNDELLSGVNYIFYVTANQLDDDVGTTKTFQIDNTQGDQKLMVEGRSDMFSVMLIGGQVAYADMEYILEAKITTCEPTQDYYFVWAVHGQTNKINLTEIKGSRLEVPAYSVRAGESYDVVCKVFRQSNGKFITQTRLPFQVLHKGLEVNLNIDVMVVSTNTAFSLESTVINHDYYDNLVTFNWNCSFEEEPCESFVNTRNHEISFPVGLSQVGYYKITLTVNILDQVAKASSSIITVEHTLPVLQIIPISRVLNENTVVSLVANASNVAPACTLTWYYATEEYLSYNITINDTCVDCKHGEAFSDSLTVFSLEENFLNELTDYSNETEWRQVTAYMTASAGRARFVAECGCSLTFSCDTAGTAYADINFQLNASPKAGDVILLPESGSALETLFRISTLAASDGDRPLRYSFYCRVGNNDSLLLGSFMEHLAVETFLPYIDGITEVWVEVCDAQGACSTGEARSVEVTSGEARTVEALIEDIIAHVRRCELLVLRKVAISAVVTYSNAGQSEALIKFTAALLDSLPRSDDRHCIKENNEQYSELLNWLAGAGIDTSSLIE